MKADNANVPTSATPAQRSLDSCLDDLKVSWFQYRLLILCGLMFMADAMEVSLLSFLSICAGETFNLTNAEIASIGSAVFAGQLLGSAVWGPIADRYGRRVSFICACVTMTVGGLLSGVSPDFGSLVAFRFIVGFGVGGATVPFDLLAEFLPTHERGSFLIFIEYFWTIGSVFVICMAWVTLRLYSWRVLAVVTVLPVGLSCCFAIWLLPESARWLLIEGRAAEAEKIVRDAAAINGAELGEFSLIISAEEVEMSKREQEKPWYLVYNPLFEGDLLKVTTPLVTVWMSFAFLYYGIILFITRIYSDEEADDGADACQFNYPPILENSISELLGVTLAILTINHMGRVKTQWLGYLLGAVGVFVMGFSAGNKGILFAFGLIARASAMGASCATWVSTPEVYPTHLRASGHSLCNIFARLAAFASPYLVFSALSNEEVAVVLCIFNLIAALAASLLPETANKSLDDARELSRSTEPPVRKLSKLMDSAIRSVSGHAAEEIEARPLNTARPSHQSQL